MPPTPSASGVNRDVPRLNELKERLGDLELALTHRAANLGDRRHAIDGLEDGGELTARWITSRRADGHMLLRRDPVAKVPRLVHAPHALEEKPLNGEVEARSDAALVVGVEEEEHAVRHEEHRIDDLLDVLPDELKQLLPRQEAELHGNLAKAHLAGHARGRDRNLLLRQGAVPIEHLAEALGLHRGARRPRRRPGRRRSSAPSIRRGRRTRPSSLNARRGSPHRR